MFPFLGRLWGQKEIQIGEKQIGETWIQCGGRKATQSKASPQTTTAQPKKFKSEGLRPFIPKSNYLIHLVKLKSYTMVNLEFQSPLLYSLLDTFAVTCISGWSSTPSSIIYKTADLVMAPTVIFIATEPICFTTHPDGKKIRRIRILSEKN